MNDIEKLRNFIEEYLKMTLIDFFDMIKKIKRFEYDGKEFFLIKDQNDKTFVLKQIEFRYDEIIFPNDADCNPFHKRLPVHLKKPVDQNIRYVCKNYENFFKIISNLKI